LFKGGRGDNTNKKSRGRLWLAADSPTAEKLQALRGPWCGLDKPPSSF